MTSYEIPNMQFSAVTGATVSRYRFVKITTDGAVIHATQGDTAVGVAADTLTVGKPIDVRDGIVEVACTEAIAVNAIVQAADDGKAMTQTTGVGLGVALTSTTTAGELVTVKMNTPNTIPLVVMPKVVVADLDAGGDLADVPMLVVPTGYTMVLKAAQIIALGADAGIDDDNTCVVALEVGETAIASATYDTDNTFPDSGAAGALTIASATLAAGSVLTYSVTNGATANPPSFIIQLTGVLKLA